MNLLEKISWYTQTYGRRALIVRAVERALNVQPRYPGALMLPAVPRAAPEPGSAPASRSSASIIDERFVNLRPLQLYSAPGTERRLNLVTDSIGTSSLFGGVGTAILLASLVARKRGATLRVITRTEPPTEHAVAHVLACNGVAAPDKIQFAFAGVHDRRQEVDVTEGDRFLTTSWWTTHSVLGSVAPAKVDYLLQEDERMFYPVGDDWVRCNELLSRDDLRMAVNTELLYRHLVSSGLPNLERCARWFEPAFPLETFHHDAASRAPGKRKLLFYARPHNSRNLFYRGIEALDHAVRSGILDPEQWELVFIGKDIPPVELGGQVVPTILPTLSWKEYAELIRSVDLGFCLMATPHPSYPPLDLAATGAVVVTNRFGPKHDLTSYSPNIHASDADVASLVEGLRDATRALERPDAVVRNYQNAGMSRDWNASLAPIVNFLD